MKHQQVYYIISLVLAVVATRAHAQQTDTSRVLEPVVISGAAKRDAFATTIPSQTLDRRTLNQLNVPSVADAAKYFSGVLVRDYGGTGGLKTVSVRSLGATHTGILYDGLPVSDAQTGQTDLGRYSSSFLYSLDLYQAQPPYQPAPARSFASGSVIALQSNAFTPNTTKPGWFAGIRQGSFGFIQPNAGIAGIIGKNLFADAMGEFIHSKGNYPFYIDNGVLSRKAKRNNSALDSWQGESNLLKQFSDSSTLQVKVFSYHSERGLPGSVLLYNEQSEQTLRNNDQFVQTRYRKQFAHQLSLLVSGKYSYSFTRYTDPAFQNNAGGLDNRYRQWETYLSAAASKGFKWINISVASDAAYTKLRSDMTNFAYPERLSLWNKFSLTHTGKHWKLDASLLLTSIHDKTRISSQRNSTSRLTPVFSAAYTPSENSPFLIRTFYKEVFRMPTFNDLYYVLIGNRNLRPEFAKQINAGIVFHHEATGHVQSIRLSADAYLNMIRDKIVAVPGQNLFSWTMLNAGKVRIPGVDVTGEINGKLNSAVTWFARLAYTFQQAKDVTDRTASNYGDRIPYTPDHSGSALLSFFWNQWSAGSSAVFSEMRYSIGDNSSFTSMDGWATADVFLAKTFQVNNIRLDARAQMDNLAGQRYDIVRSYPMPGRSYKLSVIIKNK